MKATFGVVSKRIVMGRRVASGPQVESGAGADANTWEATELKMTAGSETETAGVTGKSKETAGSESGVNTEAGMDSESTVHQSGAGAGTKAIMRCVIASGGGDVGVDLRLTVAGTTTGDDVASVAKVRVGLIVEMIPSACAVASEFMGVANARLRIGRMETEQVG